ncbi:MAG: biopolymer transporter ExbD [candidate division NC10 bacterium]|nr:biopolymer transporter ExbD [candidate division NC10 bacterium]MBI3002227.1 biopolymer transporter ExbD [candidate division NC10 bacterium]MBI4391549.1 biopolymer transporter ExbD [candidate division NC10 bacterium]
MPTPIRPDSEQRLGGALSEINVIPFVDVMLVLLVIFLVTAPMLLTGIDVRVPRTETRTVQPEERLVLTVTRDGAVFVGEQPITLARLERLLAGLRQRNAKAAVFLRADERAAYGAVVKVMDVVKKAGIDRLGMVTEPLPAS